MKEACLSHSSSQASCTDKLMNGIIFECKEDIPNYIKEITWCGEGNSGCKDGGSGKSDYCENFDVTLPGL
jgi:hypothetical protein